MNDEEKTQLDILFKNYKGVPFTDKDISYLEENEIVGISGNAMFQNDYIIFESILMDKIPKGKNTVFTFYPPDDGSTGETFSGENYDSYIVSENIKSTFAQIDKKTSIYGYNVEENEMKPTGFCKNVLQYYDENNYPILQKLIHLPLEPVEGTSFQSWYKLSNYSNDSNDNILKYSLPEFPSRWHDDVPIGDVISDDNNIDIHSEVYKHVLYYSAIDTDGKLNLNGQIENNKWNFDLKNGIISFHNEIDSKISENTPPLLTFVKYIGRKNVNLNKLMENSLIFKKQSVNIIHDNGNYVLEKISKVNTEDSSGTILDLSGIGYIKIPFKDTNDNTNNMEKYQDLGAIRYDTVENAFEGYHGSSDGWKSIGGGGGSGNTSDNSGTEIRISKKDEKEKEDGEFNPDFYTHTIEFYTKEPLTEGGDGKSKRRMIINKNGDIDISNNLKVDGSATINDLTIDNSLVISNDLKVDGSANITDLTIDNSLVISKDLNVDGSANITELKVSQDLYAKNIYLDIDNNSHADDSVSVYTLLDNHVKDISENLWKILHEAPKAFDTLNEVGTFLNDVSDNVFIKINQDIQDISSRSGWSKTGNDILYDKGNVTVQLNGSNTILQKFEDTNVVGAPSIKYFGRMVYDGNDTLYVIGGSNTTGSRAFSVRTYTLSTNAWSSINTASPPGNVNEHTTEYYKNAIYMFGGWTGNGNGSNASSISKLNLNTLTWETVGATNRPSARRAHSSTIHGSKLFIFGGYSTTGLNDLWEIDLDNPTSWVQLHNGSGTASPVRYESVMEYYNNSIFIFAGYQSKSDLWRFDLSSRSWHEISIPNEPLGGEGVAGAVIDQYMYVHGGKNGNAYSKLYQLNLVTYEWTELTSQGLSTYAHGLTYVGNNILYAYIPGDNPEGHMYVYTVKHPRAFEILTSDIDKKKSIFKVNSNGNVGIGTTDPQAKLDVRGDLNVANNLYINNGLYINGLVARTVTSDSYKTKTWAQMKTEIERLGGTMLTQSQIMSLKSVLLQVGKDKWVAGVKSLGGGENEKTWYQIGDTPHDYGDDHITDTGGYPSWGDKTDYGEYRDTIPIVPPALKLEINGNILFGDGTGDGGYEKRGTYAIGLSGKNNAAPPHYWIKDWKDEYNDCRKSFTGMVIEEVTKQTGQFGELTFEGHKLAFHTHEIDNENYSEPKMVINTDGNVGIGTVSPITKLDIRKDGPVRLRLEKSTGAYADQDESIEFCTKDGTVGFIHQLGETLRMGTTGRVGKIRFYAGNEGSVRTGFSRTGSGDTTKSLFDEAHDPDADIPQMVINTDGNVGIGTVSPTKYYDNQHFATTDRILSIHGGDATSGSGTGGVARLVLACDNYHTASIFGKHTGNGYTFMGFMTTKGTGAPEERMRIDSDGNVGIGTTSPDSQLTIMDNHTTSEPTEHPIGYSSTKYQPAAALKIFQYFKLGEGVDRHLEGGTNSNPAINIVTNHEGVGVSTEYKHVGGVIQFTHQSTEPGSGPGGSKKPHGQPYASIYGGRKGFYGDYDGEMIFSLTDTNRNDGENLKPIMIINTTGVNVTGDITAFYGSSDKRLKTNINTIENAVEIVQKLRGVRFNWNEEARKINEHVDLEKKEIGVIAQEIEEHLPEIVKKGLSDYKAIRYEKITPVLIEAIKEQQQQIKEQQQQIKAQQQQINAQQQQINAQQQQINEILNRLNNK